VRGSGVITTASEDVTAIVGPARQGRQLIVSPPASRMSSLYRNPRSYRDLPGMETVACLALALNIPGWEQRTEAMREHSSWRIVATAHSNVLQIRTSSEESVIHGVLAHLFFMIGFALGITYIPDSQRRYGVGGLIADKTVV
jgi:hypothetical protein